MRAHVDMFPKVCFIISLCGNGRNVHACVDVFQAAGCVILPCGNGRNMRGCVDVFQTVGCVISSCGNGSNMCACVEAFQTAGCVVSSRGCCPQSRPGYMVPFFCLHVFLFCLSCLTLVSYFSYAPHFNIKMWIRDSGLVGTLQPCLIRIVISGVLGCQSLDLVISLLSKCVVLLLFFILCFLLYKKIF